MSDLTAAGIFGQPYPDPCDPGWSSGSMEMNERLLLDWL